MYKGTFKTPQSTPSIFGKKERKEKKIPQQELFRCRHLTSPPRTISKKQFPLSPKTKGPYFMISFSLLKRREGREEKKKRKKTYRSIRGRPADPFHFKFLHYVCSPSKPPLLSSLTTFPSPVPPSSSVPPWPPPPRSTKNFKTTRGQQQQQEQQYKKRMEKKNPSGRVATHYLCYS